MFIPLKKNPKEAAIVGRMLLGYGELEYLFAEMLGHAIGNLRTGIRTYFRVGGESARLDMADSIIFPVAESIGLKNEYGSLLGAMNWCRCTRNRYAHCHWESGTDEQPGLFYVDMAEAAQKKTAQYSWRHVDVDILKKQEDYFYYTQHCIFFVSESIRYRVEKRSAPLTHVQWPSYIPEPSKHNSPETHTPPWTPVTQSPPQTTLARKSQRRARRVEKAKRKTLWKK
jgi:hypothetical protein